MRALQSLCVTAAILAAAKASSQSILDPVSGLALGTADVKWATYTKPLTGGFRVSYSDYNSYFVVRLPSGTSFAGRTHLDLRLKNNLAKPAQIEVNISSNNGQGWLTSMVVIGPKEALEVTMPLYEAEQYGLRALPTPTDTTRFQTRSLGSLFPNDVRGVYFYNKDTAAADVNVEVIGATNHNVPMTGFVDTFGQQRLISWPEKTSTVGQLRNAISQDPDGVYPYSADEFGGVAGGRNYGPAERFRTVKDGANWYLVTPAGNRFFSMGVNEVGAQAWTQTTGRESMFTDLPALQTNFPSHFSVRDGQLGFKPYSINLERKYGANWKSQAVPTFMKRLRSWGFNTAGVNSWDAFMSQQEMPSTFGFNLWSPHPQLHVYGGKSISDVFDPAFVTAARSDINRRMGEVGVHQPYSLGVFVDNEMPWGQGKSAETKKRYPIAVSALNSVGSASQKALLNDLKKKYTTIAALNAAWATSFSGWATLSAGNIALPTAANDAMGADLKSFVRKFANTYFRTIDQLVAESGYRGLYLGCRFTRDDYTPEVLLAAMSYADVLSFNIYHAYPSKTNPDLKKLDFPVLISEFCFGANDKGRVGMPLFPTMTESSRVDAYRRFMADIRSWPNMVGAHWYRWDDFPTTAKTDHDNMQEGLVSITDTFYTDLLAQTRQSTIDLMSSLQATP